MKEKILEKLKKQRGKNTSVSDKSLTSLSTTLASVITTDEQLESADFSEAIQSLQSNINHVSAGAVNEATLKFKKDNKGGGVNKDDEDDGGGAGIITPSTGEEITPTMKVILEQQEKILGALGTLQNDKVVNGRKGKLNEALKGAPEFFSKQINSAFSRMKFDNDEDFETYLEEVTESGKEVLQSSKEDGLVYGKPSKPVTQEETGVSPSIAKARDIIAKSKKDK